MSDIMLNIRVATKEDSERFYQFFLALKGTKIIITDISLSGLSPRNVKDLVLFVEKVTNGNKNNNKNGGETTK